jgi:hypothetical protein
MNACFEVLVPVVEKYQGTVDKFIGDAILALFGAPIAHENDPEQALHAALEMQEALADFNARNAGRPGTSLRHQHRLVVAGGIGSSGRQDYSVMGDAVNWPRGWRTPRSGARSWWGRHLPLDRAAVRVRGAAAAFLEGQGATGRRVSPADREGRARLVAGHRRITLAARGAR